MENLIGTTFHSYKEVTSFIKKFETENSVQLNRVLAKKLSAKSVQAKYKNRIGTINKDLVYYNITYMCVHGGRYKYTGAQKRKTNSTKLGCNMKIRCNVSSDGKCLKIAEAHLEHNHEISKDLFRSLPKQRRLQESEKKETLKLLKLKCDKKMVKNYIKSSTGKIVTLKDLSNLKAIKTVENSNDLVDAVEFLKRDSQSIVEVLTDEDNNLEGLFFQDKYMKKSFSNYPEVLLCDATYKLNNLRMPLYIFLIVNGNGHGEIVATFLLAHETENNISHMSKIFKQHNERWQHTVSIITDKDFKERNVFKLQFPNAQLILCLFHTLKTFRTNITTQKMQINSMQRENCLKILQKLAYSRNIFEYDENYKALLVLRFEKVTNYYNNNWHNIKEEWVQGLKKQYLTYNITTTNHLESINNKIKQVVDKMSDLKTFYEHLLIVFETIIEELRIKAIRMATKKIIHHYELNSPESKYINLVTPYAFDFIIKNITYSKTITNIKLEHDTTLTSCKCNFRINMKLPCYHIFYQRSLKNEDLFDESLVDDKFKRRNYFEHHRELTLPTPNNEETSVNDSFIPIQSTTSSIKNTILSTNEKFKKSMLVCQELASCMSEYGTENFKLQFEKLKQFTKLIKERKDFLVVEVTNLETNDEVSELPTEEGEITVENENDEGLFREDALDETTEFEKVNNTSLINTQTEPTMSGEEELIREEATSELNQINYQNNKMKRIGRPKGVNSTCVIGLKKKLKKNREQDTASTILPMF